VLNEILKVAAQGDAPRLEQTLGNVAYILVFLGPVAQLARANVFVRRKPQSRDDAVELVHGLRWSYEYSAGPRWISTSF
jgi:hypothetical protein